MSCRWRRSLLRFGPLGDCLVDVTFILGDEQAVHQLVSSGVLAGSYGGAYHSLLGTARGGGGGTHGTSGKPSIVLPSTIAATTTSTWQLQPSCLQQLVGWSLRLCFRWRAISPTGTVFFLFFSISLSVRCPRCCDHEHGDCHDLTTRCLFIGS